MKKLCSALGLVLLLTGCFEQPKKIETATNEPNEIKQTKVEQTEVQQAEIEQTDVKQTEIKQATVVTDIAKNEDQQTAQSEEKISEDNGNTAVSEKTAEIKEAGENANKNLDEKVVQNVENKVVEEKNIAEKTAATKAVAVSVKATKNIAPTKPQPKKPQNQNQLSEEEQRVGAQRVLSNEEILAMKYKCRYPFMSDKELVEFHCEVKKVIIAE